MMTAINHITLAMQNIDKKIWEVSYMMDDWNESHGRYSS
jgi:uncharacterized protein YpmB